MKVEVEVEVTGDDGGIHKGSYELEREAADKGEFADDAADDVRDMIRELLDHEKHPDPKIPPGNPDRDYLN